MPMLASVAAVALLTAISDPQMVPHDGALRFTYTDLEGAGSSDLTVHRALTTNLPWEGEFGVGFGMEDELTVTPLPGGALRVTVPGPCPACAAAVSEPSPDALARSVAAAAATLEASGASALAGEALEYARHLSDEGLRSAEWRRQESAWLAAARAETAGGVERLPLGARHRVVALPSGYLRYADPTEVQELDRSGRLVRVLNAAGVVRRIERDPAGRIVRIVDRGGRSIAFEHDGAGRVVRATAPGGGEATYGYDAAGRMTWSQSAAGRLEYGWSADGALVSVREAGTDREVKASYEPRALGGRVLTMTSQWGATERYAYERAAGGLVTAVSVYGDEAATEEDDDAGSGEAAPADPHPVRRYTYVEPLGLDGRRWTWQATVEEGDAVSVTTYDDRSFQPLVIAEGDRIARFAYDELGRVVRKEADDSVTTLAYAPNGKVSNVSVRDVDAPPSAPDRAAATFRYDDRGQLVSAESDKARAELTYDAGRIASLTIAQDAAEPTSIAFEYGDGARPTRIEVEGVGVIEVAYGPAGDIEKTESSGGRDVSLRVTSAFQVLLDLVRLADVKLEL